MKRQMSSGLLCLVPAGSPTATALLCPESCGHCLLEGLQAEITSISPPVTPDQIVHLPPRIAARVEIVDTFGEFQSAQRSYALRKR